MFIVLPFELHADETYYFAGTACWSWYTRFTFKISTFTKEIILPSWRLAIYSWCIRAVKTTKRQRHHVARKSQSKRLFSGEQQLKQPEVFATGHHNKKSGATCSDTAAYVHCTKRSPVEYEYCQVGTLVDVFAPPNPSAVKFVRPMNALPSITSWTLNETPDHVLSLVRMVACA